MQRVEIRPVHLDAYRRAHAGREHLEPAPDRHGPGVGHAGEAHGLVHLVHELRVGHPAPPLRLGLEDDGRLVHVERRRVRGGVGPARFAEDGRDLWKRGQDAVLVAHDGMRLGDRGARHRGRHEQQRSLVERRHELASDPAPRQRGHAEQHRRSRDDAPGVSQHRGEHRPVRAHQGAIDRVRILRTELAAHEITHQDGHERDRQQRRAGHGEGLGERERLEQAPLLLLEREYREERYSDDEE